MKVSFESSYKPHQSGSYNPPTVAVIMEHGVQFQHHGVKGQKWGIRRYQNEDGSYTDAGRKRYLKQVKKSASKINIKDKKSVSEHVNNYIEESDRKGIRDLNDKYDEISKSYSEKNDFENSNDYKKLLDDADKQTMKEISSYNKDLYKKLSAIPPKDRDMHSKDYRKINDSIYTDLYDKYEKSFYDKNPGNNNKKIDLAWNKLYDKVEEVSKKLSGNESWEIQRAIIDDIFEKLKTKK